MKTQKELEITGANAALVLGLILTVTLSAAVGWERISSKRKMSRK